MECYSQVYLVNSSIKGSLLIDGKNIDFTGGSIYVEKTGVKVSQHRGYGYKSIILEKSLLVSPVL